MSSSPELPSPSQIFSKSKACVETHVWPVKAPIEPTIPREGPSRASIRDLILIDTDIESPIANEKNAGEDPSKCQNKSRKRATSTKQSTEDSLGTSKAKQNAPKAPIGVAKPRKRKSKALASEGQSRIAKSKIRKPSCLSRDDSQSKKEREPPMPHAEFCPQAAPMTPGDISSCLDQPLGLDKVMARKRNWTPVKNVAAKYGPAKENTSPGGSDLLVLDLTTESDDLATPRALFDCLQDRFSYEAQKIVSCRRIPLGTATKRRKVELIDDPLSHASIQSLPAKKGKAPRKKAQTITEKATEPYMPKPKADSTLIELFSRSQAPPDRAQKPDVESRPAKKLAVKQRMARTVKKGPPPKLPPPDEAIRSMENQELLFGTSSQLVRAESPTVFRDLQQALKTPQPEGDESSFHSLGEFEVAGPHAWSTSRSNSSKRLWGAAARDSCGSVLDKVIVDLCDTPSLSSVMGFRPSRPLQAISPALKSTGIEPNKQAPTFEQGTGAINARNNENEIIPEHDSSAPNFSLPRSMAECALKDRPRPRDALPKPRKKATKATKTASLPNAFDDYTDAMLKKAVADFGFKPSTSRKKMIGILERCRESKQAPTTVEAVVPPLASASDKGNVAVEPPAKKTRGRPKKPPLTPLQGGLAATQASPEPVDGSLPGPQATSKRAPSTHQAELPQTDAAPTNAADTGGNERSVDGQADALFRAISHAIASQTPTHDPSAPTFAEKILLYDPIVLEDLTVWLNSGGLSKVDVDDEVSPSTVRDWCECRSVCCAWRVNLRGSLRKGVGSGM